VARTHLTLFYDTARSTVTLVKYYELFGFISLWHFQFLTLTCSLAKYASIDWV